ncbi:MAG: DUF4199 domain-containing protein [Ginsengibacter sp.]
MEQPITSTSSKGLTIAMILIVLSLVTYFTGMAGNSALGWLGYAIFVIGIIVSVSIYGKQINYNSSFGNYFTHGFKVSALVTAIMVIFVVVFIFTFPEVKESALDAAAAEMDKQDTMSDEQKEQAINLTRKFFMVFTIGGTLLGYMFFGTLAALVGAAITKKQPVPLSDVNTIS